MRRVAEIPRGLLGLASGIGVMLATTVVHADGGALHLTVRGDVSAEAVRDALAQDAGRPVVLDEGAAADDRVTITLGATGELAVTFASPHGALTRVVAAPGTPERVVSDASLLAASLAIGVDLAPPAPAPPPPAPPPPPPPPPPPAPPPTIVPDRPRGFTLPASASFFYPLAANFGQPGARTYFDLDVLYGRYGEVDGAQIGVASVVAPDGGASGAMRGLQIGGLFASAEHVEGLQIGGVATHAGGDVDGVQIGLVNVAGGKVHGAQIGLINVAEDVDVPIGLVSVTKSGGVHAVTWASSTTYGNLGVKFATRHTYTMLSASASYAYDRDVYGGGFTIGGHAPLSRLFYLDFDAGLSALAAPRPTSFAGRSYNELLFYPKVRAIAGLRLDPHFALFAGVGLAAEARIYDAGQDLAVSLMPDFFAGVEL